MRVFHFLKEKVNLKELWNRVCSLEPNKKVKIVVIFLAVMVGLTIISRVTYQMILPKVVMGQADSGTIRHTIHTQAEVKSLSESPVFTTEGLLVDKVVVSTGQAVRKAHFRSDDRRRTRRSECFQQADTAAESRKRWNFRFC